MIAQSQRDALKKMLKPGDISRAVNIYENLYSRKIHFSQLTKFVNGNRPFKGNHPRYHQPAHMYEAIARAIKERQQRERKNGEIARRLIEQITRDTTPNQPIPA